MKITQLSFEKIEIPFRQAFSHSSKTRTCTEAILIKAKSENGNIGYGEGCPRSYVTGESIDGTHRFFQDRQEQIIQIHTLDELKSWTEDHRAEIDKNPAAWCAIELSLLDLLGKEKNQSVEQLLSLPEIEGVFNYTAILGNDKAETFKKIFEKYQAGGWQDYKIKLSGNENEDRSKIDLLRSSNRPIRVRADANNLWKDADRAIAYFKKLDYPFFAVEEPLSVNDYGGNLIFHQSLNIPIILDESFLRPEQFRFLSANHKAWIINLRISKMGGILRSLALAEQAKQMEIPLIIGAQVGETSILTRAAITVANSFRSVLLAQEGAFGTLLLEKDIVPHSLVFGPRGELEITSFLSKPGFGLGKIA